MTPSLWSSVATQHSNRRWSVVLWGFHWSTPLNWNSPKTPQKKFQQLICCLNQNTNCVISMSIQIELSLRKQTLFRKINIRTQNPAVFFPFVFLISLIDWSTNIYKRSSSIYFRVPYSVATIGFLELFPDFSTNRLLGNKLSN